MFRILHSFKIIEDEIFFSLPFIAKEHFCHFLISFTIRDEPQLVEILKDSLNVVCVCFWLWNEFCLYESICIYEASIPHS